MTSQKINIGISSCLLGEKVRFDGQHKYNGYINKILSDYFNYISVCPEVAIGMGVPRKTVRLIGSRETPEMIEPASGVNWTSKMLVYSNKKTSKLPELCGFLFKQGSPSCGLFRTKIYQKNGQCISNGRGLFADTFCKKWPFVPVEEEGRLKDAKLREHFVERVFAYHRLKNLISKDFKRSTWVTFHERSKMLLLVHSPQHYKILGLLVANMASYSPSEFKNSYALSYMQALSVKASLKKHSDALYRILGFLKCLLRPKQKRHLIESIDRYKMGCHPLVVPVTLIKHYIFVYDVSYVKHQFYLEPYPFQLSLRNHV